VSDKSEKIQKSDEEWRRTLSPEAYRVLRQGGTERAFTGAFVDDHSPGIYTCGGCGAELFKSDAKFESGSGWPSFFRAIAGDRIQEIEDSSHGMVRTEIRCVRCGGHLGHVFPDGPEPTGMRYCVNSASLCKKP
jgi:peptide-methionine (R)-S-oxide reductase